MDMNAKRDGIRPQKVRKISGFTLVELIVVITILAILATVGFLALSGYSQDARDSAVKANVRSLQTAITSEAAVTNNSPRYYVVHDADYALSGAFAYVDGASVALTGGDIGSAPADSNYTAGKPDFKKLKLNPEKFRISSSGLPGGTLGTLARAAGFGTDSAEAAYDASSLMAAGADFLTAGTNGKKRAVSYVQTAGVSPATKIASVAGNFPSTGMPAGNVSGLLRAEPGSATNLTGALVDGGAGNGTT